MTSFLIFSFIVSHSSILIFSLCEHIFFILFFLVSHSSILTFSFQLRRFYGYFSSYNPTFFTIKHNTSSSSPTEFFIYLNRYSTVTNSLLHPICSYFMDHILFNLSILITYSSNIPKVITLNLLTIKFNNPSILFLHLQVLE
jgi:hypothetical protein